MTLRKSIEVFFGLLSLCWDKWSREPIPGRLWIILDDLPEGKNCSVRPSRIHEGLFDSCEGLIEGRLTFFFFFKSTLLSSFYCSGHRVYYTWSNYRKDMALVIVQRYFSKPRHTMP